jgi:hypothetical protein
MSFAHSKSLFFHANSQALSEQLISLCQSHELGNFAINLLNCWKKNPTRNIFRKSKPSSGVAELFKAKERSNE